MAHNSSIEHLRENEEILEEATLEQLNGYSQQKSYAKGLVDLALVTANANQLRYAWGLENEGLRVLNIVLLTLSIGLQVTFYVKDESVKLLYHLVQGIFPFRPKLLKKFLAPF